MRWRVFGSSAIDRFQQVNQPSPTLGGVLVAERLRPNRVSRARRPHENMFRSRSFTIQKWLEKTMDFFLSRSQRTHRMSFWTAPGALLLLVQVACCIPKTLDQV